MNTVSMLELRQDAERILQRVKHGESLLLTYRGKPALRLEPLVDAPAKPSEADPLFTLPGLVENNEAGGLSNADMDALVYGD